MNGLNPSKTFNTNLALAPNGTHVRSPSIAREFWENKQEVCFSDDATWMSHRNDHNSLRSAGNRSKLGVFSFAYFSLDKQRKVRPAAGKQNISFVKTYF
jgi:hypothetical protein